MAEGTGHTWEGRARMSCLACPLRGTCREPCEEVRQTELEACRSHLSPGRRRLRLWDDMDAAVLYYEDLGDHVQRIWPPELSKDGSGWVRHD